MNKTKKEKISNIFEKHLNKFAKNLKKDYKIGGSKYKNLKNKENNFLIHSLGPEISFYSTFMRSLDSSLGNIVEDIIKEVVEIDEVGYKVSKGVEGKISEETISKIAELLEIYKNKDKKRKVHITDLDEIKTIVFNSEGKNKFHNSDYILEKKKDGILYLYLLELKLGGDLDNKKARSEKEAILEQYAILCDQYKKEIKNGSVKIKLFFSTVYNKNSLDEGKEGWKQGNVESFFSNEELMIGKDLWNFIIDEEDGFNDIKELFDIHLKIINSAIKSIVNDIV